MKRPITILIDMDGVIVDWDKGFRDIWRDRSPIWRSNSYLMQECVPIEFKAEATTIPRQPGFFAQLPPYENAIESVKRISCIPGLRVLICTSPLLANPTCFQDKLFWITRHFGPEWLEKVVFTRDKTVVRGDIIIDDKPDVSVGAEDPTWIHAVFQQPYNSHLCVNRFKYRMTSWSSSADWENMLASALQERGYSISLGDQRTEE